jgi:hypothetical protein
MMRTIAVIAATCLCLSCAEDAVTSSEASLSGTDWESRLREDFVYLAGTVYTFHFGKQGALSATVYRFTDMILCMPDTVQHTTRCSKPAWTDSLEGIYEESGGSLHVSGTVRLGSSDSARVDSVEMSLAISYSADTLVLTPPVTDSLLGPYPIKLLRQAAP